MKKRYTKKGQIYLIAAVVIVGIILALATIINYSKKKNPIEIYNIGEELGTESVNILEYGTYKQLNNTQMKALLISFIGEYSRYGNIERLYFIFGNLTEIAFVGYHEFIVDRVYVTAGGITTNITIPRQMPDGGEENPVVEDIYPNGIENISIEVIRTNYNFRLRAGENFYFIIFQEEGGEQHVIQGGNRLNE